MGAGTAKEWATAPLFAEATDELNMVHLGQLDLLVCAIRCSHSTMVSQVWLLGRPRVLSRKKRPQGAPGAVLSGKQEKLQVWLVFSDRLVNQRDSPRW